MSYEFKDAVLTVLLVSASLDSLSWVSGKVLGTRCKLSADRVFWASSGGMTVGVRGVWKSCAGIGGEKKAVNLGCLGAAGVEKPTDVWFGVWRRG